MCKLIEERNVNTLIVTFNLSLLNQWKQRLKEFLNIEKAGQIGDDEYSRYHQQNADWYRNFGDKFNSILGFTGQTKEEFMNFISSIQLTSEQKRALTEVRREPMFKKLMGKLPYNKKLNWKAY